MFLPDSSNHHYELGISGRFFYHIAMKKCKKCGATISDDSLYCYKCGAPVEESGPSINDYAGNDVYHSASVEPEPVEPESVGVEDEEGRIEPNKSEERNVSSAPTRSGGGYDSVFAILCIVFGALGGLLSIVFGVLVLTSPNAKDEDKTKAYIGLGLCAFWFVLLFILLIILFLNA